MNSTHGGPAPTAPSSPSPAPDRGAVSLSITLSFEPPLPADVDVHAIGQAAAEAMNASGAATTSPGPGLPVDQVTWTIPALISPGRVLADWAVNLERRTRDVLAAHGVPHIEQGQRVHTEAIEVLSMAEVDRRLAVDRFPDVVGIDEVCKIIGVKRAMGYRHTTRPGFPPRARAGASLWFRAGVERYAAELRGDLAPAGEGSSPGGGPAGGPGAPPPGGR